MYLPERAGAHLGNLETYEDRYATNFFGQSSNMQERQRVLLPDFLATA